MRKYKIQEKHVGGATNSHLREHKYTLLTDSLIALIGPWPTILNVAESDPIYLCVCLLFVCLLPE